MVNSSKRSYAGEVMGTLGKQSINIGNQSNDGTGDSIRDAFGKTNSNFDILFSASGLGSGLRFTALQDAPNDLAAQKLIVTDASGLTLTQLSLVAGSGVSINTNYSSGTIVISNTASALYTDTNPYLSANLSGANSFRAVNFAAPVNDKDLVTRRWLYDNFINRDAEYVYQDSQQLTTTVVTEGSTFRHNTQIVLASVNTSSNVGKTITVFTASGTTSTVDLTKQAILPAHITRKDYVDTKISLQGTETIDPATGEINAGFGQMTGRLYLARDPVDSDGPLIATTKNYVDNNGYYSATNLYVTTKGRDSQPDIPAYKRGRFFQYAFATINKAAQYAEQLIATSRIEVGDYARLITHDDGIACDVDSITNNYGGSKLARMVLNAGSLGSDQFGAAPVGKYTIFPGQYVEGVDSKAIGLIEGIERGVAGQEIYTIQYVDYADDFDTNIVTSIPDPINYPNQVKFTFTPEGSELVPIPDFWVGYQFYTDSTEIQGTIISISSDADIYDNYSNSFVVEFVSGAPGSNQTYDSVDWHVYSGDFLVGETILYNTNVSSLQISIMLESGEYYEQLPIKLAANVSIRGDEFRRCIIRPAAGVSTSQWTTTYFRRDTQIDGLQIVPLNTSTNLAIPGATATVSDATGDITVTLSTGSIPSTYKNYMFGGNGGQGVITACNGSSFSVTVDNNGLLNTDVIAAGDWAIYEPINFGYHYLTDPTDITSTPKLNAEMDVFLMNDATILRYISCQNHGGFMKVLDPSGQIKNKSPYTQTASSFSQSIARQRFAGGMFVDGFCGNLIVTPTNTPFADPLNLTVNGLRRRPEVPTFFVNNGVRYEVDFIKDFADDGVLPDGSKTYSATLSLNPLTPGGIPDTVSVSDSVGGFKINQTNIPIIISSPSGVGGIAATGHAVSNGSGRISSIVIDFPGTGYIDVPTISIGGGIINNLQIVGGIITDATVAYGGESYTVGAVIKIIPQNATGVTTATGVVSAVELSTGKITAITINDGGTGWDSSVVYKVQFGDLTITVPNSVAGFIDTVPDTFELITAGNRSMLANDFTQINDLGYGIFVTNGGFAENVSMFTYYCYRSYYSLNGAQIRSTTGSSCYGEWGLCAEGSDPNEVPINVKLSYPLTQVATAYVSYPLYPASEGETSIYVTVDPANGGYPALGSSQIEINHSGIIRTYSIGSAVPVADALGVVIPNLYQLSFNSGNVSSSGLLTNVANGTPVTIRVQGLNKFFGVNPESFSRSSTVLTMDDDPTNTYHITEYSTVQADSAVFIYTLENYNYIALQSTEQGVTYPKITNTGSGYTAATVTINNSGINTGFTHTVNGNQGSALAGVQVLTVNSVANVIVGHSVSGTSITTGTVVTFVDSANTQIGISIPTTGLIANNTTLTFTGVSSSGTAVISGGHISGITINSGGTGWLSTTTTISVSASDGGGVNAVVTSPIVIAGNIGSRTIKVTPIDSGSQSRIDAGLAANPIRYFQFGYNGQVFNITAYRSTSVTGQTWAEVDIDQPLDTAVGQGTTLYAGVSTTGGGKITTRLSLLRVTGHDLVDVGTGGYADTRIPNDLYGPPVNRPQQSHEVVEKGAARVYYATTDQDGNFRVGTAFLVNQAKGSITISAPIDLRNLGSISLKKDLGVPITEFSIDNTMVAQVDYKVPTEQAVAHYIDRRLGLDRSGNVTNLSLLSGGGFVAVNGKMAMKADLNLGNNRITNLDAPGTGQGSDAANKSYVDQRIEKRGTDSYDLDGVTHTPEWGKMTGPLQLVADPVTITTTTNATVSSGTSLPVGRVEGTFLKLQVNGTNIPEGTVVSSLNFSLNTIILSNAITGSIPSGTVITLDPVYQAATKGYVDKRKQFNQLRDVAITNPANLDLAMFSSTVLTPQTSSGATEAVYNTATQVINVANDTSTILNTSAAKGGGSDIAISRLNNTVTFKLVGGQGANNPITDYHVNNSAAIAQSKLSMTAASTRANASGITQADRGLASFDSSYFSATSGWISLSIGNNIVPTTNNSYNLGSSGSKFATVYANTLSGALIYDNSSRVVTSVTPGGSNHISIVAGNVTTGPSTSFTITSDGTNSNIVSTLVARDSSGNFSAGTITATLSGNASSATRLSDSGGAGTLRIANPGGAALASPNGTENGAIKIKLPTASFKSDTMLRMTIKIYEYRGDSAGTSRTIDVGGYNYSDVTANWYNYFATQTTMGGNDINIRFGNDGTSQCIWIGEIGSTWLYPQISVTDFQAGYSNNTDAIWGTGWAVSFATAFDTVTQGPIIAAKNITSAQTTSSNTSGTIVARDASGNFSAGTITASLSGNATSADKVNHTLSLGVSGTGLSGSASFDGSGAQTFTVASNATNANTGGTIVARDNSGNFSAGTITATFSGDLTGNVTGNVSGTSGSISGFGNPTASNTVSTIVYRDASGNFACNAVTAVGAVSTPALLAGVAGDYTAVGNITGDWRLTGTSKLQATYADLAEKYRADAEYAPGTVLEFGGTAEVTIAEDSTRRVAGVVSTNPAYSMNSECQGEFVAELALTGRVPCKVRGKVSKGDMMVSAGGGFARAEYSPILGSVIGKALEDFDGGEGVIEVVVGRL